MSITDLMSDLLADYDSRGVSLRELGWKFAARPRLDSPGIYEFRMDSGRKMACVRINTNLCPYNHDAGMRLWLRDTLDLELLYGIS